MKRKNKTPRQPRLTAPKGEGIKYPQQVSVLRSQTEALIDRETDRAAICEKEAREARLRATEAEARLERMTNRLAKADPTPRAPGLWPLTSDKKAGKKATVSKKRKAEIEAEVMAALA